MSNNKDTFEIFAFVAALSAVGGIVLGSFLAKHGIIERSCEAACDRRGEMMLAQEANICACNTVVLHSDYGRMWTE